MNVRRLIGTAAAAAIAGASLLYLSTDAQAASTVPAQLSLTGVATASSPFGGTTVGLHPGDTLQLSASTAPTAGLARLNLGGGGLVSSLAGYEVIVHLPATFPGGARNVTLGYKAATQINFPTAGTYPFTWNAYEVVPSVLGPQATPISLTTTQIQQAHIAVNAQHQWVGQVVVSNNPPSGGIGIQLPSTTISPSLPVGNLPSVTLPGLTTPTLPAIPGLPTTGKLPGAGSQQNGEQLNYHPYGPSVADQVMPKGYGSGSGASDQYVAPGLGGAGSASGTGAGSASGSGTGSSAGGSSAVAGKAGPAAGTGTPTTVDLASDAGRNAVTGLPSLLVIAAVLALSAATAFYARTYLLHRPQAARVTRHR